jgi:hypothetical protein
LIDRIATTTTTTTTKTNIVMNRGPTVPKIESSESSPVPATSNKMETFKTQHPNVDFILEVEKEMLCCCDDAEALIAKCRETKDPATCKAATREMAICMHYQQETEGW